MCAKWDKRHGSAGQTYGELTIAKAILGCHETFDPRAPEFPNLLADQIPVAEMVGEKDRPAYGAYQIATLLYPEWGVAALDTNMAHAMRLKSYLGDDLHYAIGIGWLHFNGKSWTADGRKSMRTAAIVARLSRQVRAEAQQLYHLADVLAQANRMGDARAMSAAASKHNSHARNVEKREFVVDTLHFAAGLDGVSVEASVFEPRPWLVGFENGVWDHGIWRRHQRDDYFLYLSPVKVNPALNSSEWDAVLKRITGGDADLARTLQELAGYILSGIGDMRLIPWAYGGTGTGKGTFTELLLTVLGKKATSISPDKLNPKADRGRTGANLWNKGLAVCPEAGNKQIEPELLKTLSGGDTMTVRLLYNEVFDAYPRHVLFLVSNDPPRLDAYDDALKGRILVLPFVHPLNAGGQLTLTSGPSILTTRKNPESPLVVGFTNWALEGLAKMQKNHDIFRAKVVEGATEQFWKDTDPLTDFWETIPVHDLELGIFAAELRLRYHFWCEGVGAKEFSPAAFKRACESMGLVQVRRTQKNIRTWILPKATPITPEEIAEANAVRKHRGSISRPLKKGVNLNIFGTPVVTGDGSGQETPFAVNFPQEELMKTLDDMLDEVTSPKTAKAATKPAKGEESGESAPTPTAAPTPTEAKSSSEVPTSTESDVEAPRE